MTNGIRRIAPAAALAAALMVVPAHAKKPDHAGPKHGGHAEEGKRGGKGSGKSGRCKAHQVGWAVKGTLVSHTLTSGTDGKFSGDVVVTVTRANKHGRGEVDGAGPKTYTVSGVKASFDDLSDRNADGAVDAGDVQAGDKVVLVGRVAKAKKRCAAPEAAAATVRKVNFSAPEPTEAEEPAEQV